MIFVGDLMIIFHILSLSEMHLLKQNLGKSGGAGKVKEAVLEKGYLILLILSEKKRHKVVGKTYLTVMRRKYCFRNGV